MEHQAPERVPLLLQPPGSDDLGLTRLVAHLDVGQRAELTHVSRRRCRSLSGLQRQFVQRVAQRLAAGEGGMGRVQGALSCSNVDVQELEMGCEWLREGERRFKHEIVAFPTTDGHEDRFHLGLPLPHTRETSRQLAPRTPEWFDADQESEVPCAMRPHSGTAVNTGGRHPELPAVGGRADLQMLAEMMAQG